MRRVYGIWFVRGVLPLFAAEVVVLTAIVFGAKSYISFEHIMNNAVYRITHHPTVMVWGYIVDAFTNAEFVSLVFLLGAVLVGAFIVRDTLRSVRYVGGNFFRFRRVT